MSINMSTQVYILLREVPRGKVTTYKELAKKAGTSPRIVGFYMKTNEDAPRTPCHRVIKSDGRIGGYTHPEGLKKKIELLKSEGTLIKNGKIVDFEKKLYKW